MQEKYHLGFFKSKNWTCCLKEDKNNIGCQEAYKYQAKDSPLIGMLRSVKYENEPIDSVIRVLIRNRLAVIITLKLKLCNWFDNCIFSILFL